MPVAVEAVAVEAVAETVSEAVAVGENVPGQVSDVTEDDELWALVFRRCT